MMYRFTRYDLHVLIISSILIICYTPFVVDLIKVYLKYLKFLLLVFLYAFPKRIYDHI